MCGASRSVSISAPSFPLDAVNVLADASAPPSKRPRIDPSAAAAEDATKSETTEKDPAADDDDEESDPALRPALGHVSMLTSVALADGPSSSSGAGRERYIITGDRDEHLRVSRWGPRRAGHVVENFLSGSTSFVGALAVLPSSACPAGSPAPLVLASDGGRFLRTWAYFANAPSPKCVAAVDVSAAILPHVSVDPEREKVREAGSSGGYTDAAGDEGKQRRGRRGKPPKQGKKGNQGAKEDNSEPAQLDPALLKRVEDGRLAIAQLHVFGQDARHWVLFTAEG